MSQQSSERLPIQDSAGSIDSKRFWAQRTEALGRPLRLYGVPISAEPTADPHWRMLELSRDESAAIRARCDEWQISLHLFWLAAVSGYLARVGEAETLGIHDASSRWLLDAATAETQTNFSPVCISLEASDTFASLMTKLSADLEDVARHSRWPDVSHERTRSDISFTYSTIERANESDGLAAIADGPAAGRQAPDSFGVALDILDAGDSWGFQIRLALASDALGEAVADAALEHFANLLKAFVANPDRKIRQLSMLSSEEQMHLCNRLDTREAHSDSAPSFLEQFDNWVARTPGQAAVTDGHRSLDYAALNLEAERLARELLASGIEVGDRIVVCLNRSVDLVIAMLAAFRIGAVYVPLDPANPQRRLHAIIDSTRPQLIVAHAATIGRLPAGEIAALIIDEGRAKETSSTEPLNVDVSSARLSNIIYTSGSTGTPKGVAVMHSGLGNHLESMREILDFDATDRLLAVTTAAFDAAMLEMCLPLWCGGCLEIVDDVARRDPAAMMERLHRGDITAMFATPATWQMLIDRGWQGGGDLKVIAGGEALSRELADALLARSTGVWNIYGPTETTICSTVEHVPADGAAVSIGEPIRRTVLRILNDEHQLVPQGVPGELFIGGAGVADGYFGQPELTNARFIDDPFEPGSRLYRTGDIVRLDHHGKLQYLGRADSQMKLRGYRIEAGEIEAALREHEDVNDAVVMMRGEQLADHHLEAYVVAHEHLDVSALLDHLRARVPRYMVPARVISVPHFPLSTNGKVDRQALIKGHSTLLSDNVDLPRTDLESRVAQIWRDHLERDVDRNASFFDQGGNSLMAVKLLSEIEDSFGVAITFGAFYDDPSIAGLARSIEEGGETRLLTSPVRLNGNKDTEPALFCISGVHLYQELGKALEDAMPVYGVYVHEDQELLANLNRGRMVTLQDTAAIATQYMETIREHQTEGPYRLAGFSYGGIIAYELARQLEAAGQAVECLVLLDTPLNRAVEREKGPVSLAKHALRVTWDKLSFHITRSLTSDQLRLIAADHYESVIQTYSGRVLLCSAIDESAVRQERSNSLGWDKYVPNLSVQACPGDHFGMITGDNAEILASTIDGFVEQRDV